MLYGCHSMSAKMDAVLIKRVKEAFVCQENLENSYKTFGYLECPDFVKASKEYEAFEKIICENVENVYYLPYDQRAGLDSIYTHDSFKVTKHGAIYFPMGKELRSTEYLANQQYLESIGIPTLGVIKRPGKIEGGDVVWLDEKTVAIGRGYRTNDEGIRQFKELTKDFIDNYVVVPMPHGEGVEACLHLMSVISIIADDMAVVYSKFMPVFFRELLIERGMQLIEVDDEEYERLGSNVLAIKPKVCLIIAGNPKIHNKLEETGCKVFTYEGYNMSYLGTGGPTCLTHPLCRL